MYGLMMSVTWGSLVAERLRSPAPDAQEFFFPAGQATRGDLIITIRGTPIDPHSLKDLINRSSLHLRFSTRI